VLKVVFFTSVKNTFNTVNYKEQILIKLASTKNVTFNVSCIKNFLIESYFRNDTKVVRAWVYTLDRLLPASVFLSRITMCVL
jgi:hypothetical protein